MITCFYDLFCPKLHSQASTFARKMSNTASPSEMCLKMHYWKDREKERKPSTRKNLNLSSNGFKVCALTSTTSLQMHELEKLWWLLCSDAILIKLLYRNSQFFTTSEIVLLSRLPHLSLSHSLSVPLGRGANPTQTVKNTITILQANANIYSTLN